MPVIPMLRPTLNRNPGMAAKKNAFLLAILENGYRYHIR